MSERITILGSGAMATVCSILLTGGGGGKGGHAVTMWGAHPESIERLKADRQQARLLPGAKIPEAVRLTSDDKAALDGTTMILTAVPTQYMRSAWKRLAPYVPSGVPVVSVSKGIENQTLLRPTQIVTDVLTGTAAANPPVAVLSGPNIAAELARYLPGTAVAAASDATLAQRVQRVFSAPWFRVYTNDDVLGVELAGATKNIIAIAAGILDGMKAGNNAKASLVTRGLVEISRLGEAMGAQGATFQGLAGLGDLITTCVAPEGRNRSVGERIGRGEKLRDILASMPSVAEGVPTTKAVREMARQHGVEMPITDTLHDILFEDKEVRVALNELMSRDPKPERE